MASRAGTLTSETILRPDSNNFRVRVSVRVPFKLVIRSKTPVNGRNVETPCSYNIRYSYMLRFAKFASLYSCEALFLSLHLLDCILAFWRSMLDGGHSRCKGAIRIFVHVQIKVESFNTTLFTAKTHVHVHPQAIH